MTNNTPRTEPQPRTWFRKMVTGGWRIYLFAAFVSFAFPLLLHAEVVIYPDPGPLDQFKNLWKSQRYAVRVNGKAVTVYASRNRTGLDTGGKGQPIPKGYISEAHFCYFSFAGEPVNLQITRPDGLAFPRASVHPTRFAIPNRIENGRILLTMDRPRKIVVKTVEEELYPLVILADRPDTAIPTGPNVTRYGPGIHDIGFQREIRDGETIYIDGGAIVKGTLFKPKGKGPLKKFTLRGRGILYAGDYEFLSRRQGWGRGITGWEGGLQNGTIEGCILLDSVHWNMGFPNTGSSFTNLKIISFYGNTDGLRIGPDSVCRDSFVMTNDDSLLPEGNFPKGTAALFEDCIVWHHAWGSPFKIINLLGPGQEGVHDLIYRNIDVLEAGTPGSAAVFLSPDWQARPDRPRSPTSNILFENIYIERAHKLFDLRPPVGSSLSNITFRNIYAPIANGRIEGFSDSNCIDGIVFTNIVINGKKIRTIGPPLENFLNYPVSFIDLVCLGRAVYCPASVGVLHAPFQQGCGTCQSSGKTFI